ncbi:MAG TPA: hypothetical protein V6C65_06550 [Allocoleopsis sp.]
MLSNWLSTRGKNGQKQMLMLVLALAISLSSSACHADNSITSNALCDNIEALTLMNELMSEL